MVFLVEMAKRAPKERKATQAHEEAQVTLLRASQDHQVSLVFLEKKVMLEGRALLVFPEYRETKETEEVDARIAFQA